jgi:hypothetical protein
MERTNVGWYNGERNTVRSVFLSCPVSRHETHETTDSRAHEASTPKKCHPFQEMPLKRSESRASAHDLLVGFQRHFKYAVQMCELCEVPVPGTREAESEKIWPLFFITRT